MSQIVFLRHGPTAWNIEGRVQGQTDVPLSETGREAVLTWQLPDGLVRWDWYASPLVRATETAALLGAPASNLKTDSRLMEVNWGDWEGRILRELRAEMGEVMRRNEARGLDMAPPNGESPRQVVHRLAGWLRDIAPAQRDACVVCHAGVLRAAYTHATGWDMKRAAPLERGHAWAHRYALSPDGSLETAELNIRLADREPPSGYDR